jgi:hypothetical protein
MTIYLSMIKDRHTDPEAFPFSTAEKAIEFARAKAKEYALSPEDFEEHQTPQGWLYYATYSCESDSVWVLEKELDGEEI